MNYMYERQLKHTLNDQHTFSINMHINIISTKIRAGSVPAVPPICTQAPRRNRRLKAHMAKTNVQVSSFFRYSWVYLSITT